MRTTIIAVTGLLNPGMILVETLDGVADHIVPDQWLQYDFWKESEACGLWFGVKTPMEKISADQAKEDVTHGYLYTAVYVFRGTFEEFLRRFSRLPMDRTVKQCPNPKCRECFVSPPVEFFKHVIECHRRGKLT